ncbi:MAG: ATP-dependent Clp protease proteolytic subunit [Hyphomonadaceae bacterium]
MTRLDQDDEKTPPEAPASPIIEKALFKSRVALLTGEVNDVQARRLTERLFALAGESDEPITIVVSSPGGHVESGDMIHDVVRFIKPKVNMLGAGWVASAGALIYCAVPKAQRFCLPNTRFLLHEPRGGVGGVASDIEIQAREILRMRERLNKIFAEATGQPLDRIKKDTDRDHWMLPDEAVAYGLVGKVVRTAAELG